jgi:hypothetical protein
MEELLLKPVGFPEETFDPVPVHRPFKIPFGRPYPHLYRLKDRHIGGIFPQVKYPERKDGKSLPRTEKRLNQLAALQSLLTGKGMSEGKGHGAKIAGHRPGGTKKAPLPGGARIYQIL